MINYFVLLRIVSFFIQTSFSNHTSFAILYPSNFKVHIFVAFLSLIKCVQIAKVIHILIYILSTNHLHGVQKNKVMCFTVYYIKRTSPMNL